MSNPITRRRFILSGALTATAVSLLGLADAAQAKNYRGVIDRKSVV